MDLNTVSTLTAKIADIKKFSPNWYMFSQNGTLTDSEVDEFVKFDGMDIKSKIDYFEQDDQTICEILIKLLNRVTVERIIQYVLLLLDNIIMPEFQATRHFIDMVKKVDYDIYSVFCNLLNKEDIITNKLASKVISKIISFGYNDFPESFVIILSQWIKKQLETGGNEFVLEDLSVCQLILRISSIRKIFHDCSLINSLTCLLMKSSNFQTQYQISFCLWLLAYEQSLGSVLVEHKVITIFSDILKTTQRNKVIRIILAACRNMVEKADQPNKILTLFVYNKFIPILQSFNKRVFNDEDLEEDLNILTGLLLKTVQDLSTYDEYAGELLNGKLEWTPVHKSDKFWRENAQRLIENGNELLLVLINTVKNSQDPIALAVACHDIGEFVRYYSRGKLAVEKYGAIEHIITLLHHDDPNVKYEALVSLQKIMIHNWDFLGKQLASTGNQSKVETTPSVLG